MLAKSAILILLFKLLNLRIGLTNKKKKIQLTKSGDIANKKGGTNNNLLILLDG